jgi:hypothetical protein
MVKAYLTLQRIEGEDRTFPLEGRVTVGRSRGNAIYLPIPSISRRHAAIYLVDDRAYIEDLGSRNGTFVNGKQIEKTILSPGDRIQIGDTAFTFLHGEADSEQPKPIESPNISNAEPTQAFEDKRERQEGIIESGSVQTVHCAQDDGFHIEQERLLGTIECYFSSVEDLANRIHALLNEAKISICFAVNALDETDMLNTLLAQRNRGTDVRGILSLEQFEKTSDLLTDAIEKGLPLRIVGPDDPRMLHSFIIIDERTVIDGPLNRMNKSKASTDRHLLVIGDESIVRQFLTEFKRIWGNLTNNHQTLGVDLPLDPPQGLKPYVSELLKQGSKAEAAHVINMWSEKRHDTVSVKQELQEACTSGSKPLVDREVPWAQGGFFPEQTGSFEEKAPPAVEAADVIESAYRELNSEAIASDYWHIQVGEGLTRREIYMMKQKLSNVTKRLFFLTSFSFILSLFIIFVLPQMFFLNYIAFFSFIITFSFLYVTLILFNYKLAKAFGKNAPLSVFLSLFFVPGIFVYAWLMNKS